MAIPDKIFLTKVKAGAQKTVTAVSYTRIADDDVEYIRKGLVDATYQNKFKEIKELLKEFNIEAAEAQPSKQKKRQCAPARRVPEGLPVIQRGKYAGNLDVPKLLSQMTVGQTVKLDPSYAFAPSIRNRCSMYNSNGSGRRFEVHNPSVDDPYIIITRTK